MMDLTRIDRAAQNRSVVEQPPGRPSPTPGVDMNLGASLFFVASRADGITPWGWAPTARDRQLRAFLPNEPFTMGAIGTIIATNVGMNWQLEGPPALVERTMDVFNNAQFGDGMETYVGKQSMDYFTQDKQSITELVRDFDNPNAPVLAFNQLDALQCWHTGNRDTPVIYQSPVDGKWHGLKWYQCFVAGEMPVAHEKLYGLQYSALTRILMISQILRNVFIQTEERTGGHDASTIYVVSGVRKAEIENAVKLAQGYASAQGNLRYMQPVIVPTVDPNAKPEVTELRLKGLPDGFSEKIEEYFKWFLTAIAMGLLRDYQDFAPLPGGGLGTSAQSQILHLKTRGKGPAIWQKKMAHAMNNRGVIPRAVTFKFDESDVEEEQSRADILATYAQGYASLVEKAIIDPTGVRQLMLEAKLMPQGLFDELETRMKAVEAEAQRREDAQLQALAANNGPPNRNNGQGNSNGPDIRPSGEGTAATNVRESVNGSRGMTVEFTDERLFEEGKLTSAAERALEESGKAVRSRLGAKTFAMGGRSILVVDLGGIEETITRAAGRSNERVEERLKSVEESQRETQDVLNETVRQMGAKVAESVGNLKLPAPVVNIPAPIVNVPPANITVEPPIVNVPAPVVNVEAPNVNVPAPVVNVEQSKEAPRRSRVTKQVERGPDGRIVAVHETHEEEA